jgi:hypothetical protein
MLQKRVEVFQDFMSSGKFKDLSLDGDKQDVLMKVRYRTFQKLSCKSRLSLRYSLFLSFFLTVQHITSARMLSTFFLCDPYIFHQTRP